MSKIRLSSYGDPFEEWNQALLAKNESKSRKKMSYLIRDGLVVDGSGAPGVVADVRTNGNSIGLKMKR